MSTLQASGEGWSGYEHDTQRYHGSQRSLSFGAGGAGGRGSIKPMQPQIIYECDGVEWLCILSSHLDWLVKRYAALI